MKSLFLTTIARRRQPGFENSHRCFSVMAQDASVLAFSPHRRKEQEPPPPAPLSSSSSSSFSPTNRRNYSNTAKQPIVLPALVLVAGGLGYVAYKSFKGQDLTPDSAKEAQAAYQKFHAQRKSASGTYSNNNNCTNESSKTQKNDS